MPFHPVLSVIIAGSLAVCASAEPGERALADFEGGVNVGGWTYDSFDLPTPIDPEGGNPGGMLRQQLCCGVFAPAVHTVGASPFTGDWRARGVISIRVDARVFALEPELFPLSLRLQTDAGTPADEADDFAVFFAGGTAHALPPADSDVTLGVWRTIVFDVPSRASGLPTGWTLHPADPLFGTVPPGADWNVAIENVTRVSFEYGPPTPYWPIEYYDLAIDSVVLVGDASSFCDGSDDALDACPCGNAGSSDSGCDNAQGTGGVRVALAAQTTTPNGATLTGTGFPIMGAPTAIVLRSNALDPSTPVVFGDGLRCVSSIGLVRLAATVASSGVATHSFGHGAMAGTGASYYQIWYRNIPSNYCTPAAFNLSNGVMLVWP